MRGGFGEAIGRCFGNYANFSGRATRAEYWWFVLFLVIGSIVFAILDLILNLRNGNTIVSVNGVISRGDGQGLLSGAFSTVTLIPSLAVAARRLHDAGHSGLWIIWCLLLTLACGAGLIVAIVFYCQRSQDGANAYGESSRPPLDSMPTWPAFVDNVRVCLSKYATFSGRASRSEFWWFYAFVIVGAGVLLSVDSLIGWQFGAYSWEFTLGRDVYNYQVTDLFGPLWLVFSLATFVPMLAVTARRLHDAGHSGLWILWGVLLTPVLLLGPILLTVFTCQRPVATVGQAAELPAT